MGLLLLTAPWGLSRLAIDNNIEQWVEAGAEGEQYARFRDDFGGDDHILLAYEGGDLFGEAALDLQLQVLSAIEAIPEVDTVKSIPSLFRDQFGAESPEELAEEVTSSPFYDHVIVSPDRSMGGMIISSQHPFSAMERREYVAALQGAGDPLVAAGWRVHWAGPGVLNAVLDTESERESRRLLPVAVLASCLLLGVLLRSLRKVAAAAGVSALTVLVTLGLMGWLGLTMNMVTVALPPVLWVLSMAYMVHLLRYHEAAMHEGATSQEALARAVDECAKPCLLAALTTALGFLSLCTAGMAPVRELGLAGGLGIPVGFLATMGLGPLLIAVLRIRAGAKGENHEAPRRQAWRLLHERHTTPILIATAAFTVVFSLLSTQVRTESNPLTFLKSDAAIVRDSEVIAKRFSGLYTLETVLQLPGSWLDDNNWAAIAQQANALSAETGIARVINPLDYLKKINQWSSGAGAEGYVLPESAEAARALVDAMPPEARGPLNALVSPDGTRVRLSSLVRVMDGAALLDIVRRSQSALARAPEGITGYHTGVVLRLVKAQFSLIDAQIDSLALAVAVVFACVWIGLGSTRLMLFSLAPNLLPIAGLFGAMGLAGIPLDPATVMVAAIAVGIAVDDTLHLLSSWRERLDNGLEPLAALRSAILLNGPAVTATTMTACAGFLSLAFSSFSPIRYFGLLSAGVMAIALAADIWLLPATMKLTFGRNAARS